MSFQSRASWAFVSLLLGAAASGCVESVGPEDAEDDVDSADENVSAAQSALATCVTIQRGGTGNIQDTLLSADYPGWATGNEPSLYTGKSGGGGMNRSLLRADLASIPAGSTVTSATLNLSASWTDESNQVGVYPVLSPWSEATATAGNFDAATGIGAVAAASFAAGNGGTKSVNVTGLVAQWVNGSLANNGLALQEPAAQSHLFWSSETSMKPTLTVCYEPPPAGPYMWSKAFYHAAIAGDPGGNTIGAGGFYGTVDFGAGPITSTYTTGQYVSATQDVYVVKFGPTGNALWSKKFGDEYIINPDNARDQNAQAVATDAAGNVYVSGTFKGVVVNAYSPGYSEASYPGVYTLQLDPSGNHVFSTGHYANGWGTVVKRVGADNQGGMYVFGDCSVALGAYCQNGSFLFKDATSGGAGWSHGCRPTSFGSYGRFTAMAVDGSGSAIMSATYSQAGQGGVDCGDGSVALQHAQDLLLVKHDSAGTLAWIKQYPATGSVFVTDLVADASNNVFMSLFVSGSLTMGATTFGSGSFVVKLDPDMFVVWSTSLVGASPRKLDVLPGGKIALAGLFANSIDFGAGPVSGYGSNDFFVSKLEADGTPTGWGLTIGGPASDTDLLMATDGLGGIALRGYLNAATFNFGQGATGPSFVTRVAP